MTINIAFEIEQQQRIEAQTIEVEDRLDNEASRETELYTAGNFDGVIGIEPDPEKWGEYAYRNGFLTGVTRHYDQKYQMSLNNEPF